MPIVIQELLASDTLSQAVDKVNFNFDQLLLNGGGPVGPAGIPGPTGPVGGRGIRGATWYNGSANPNTLIIPGIEEDDYFLQDNGQVWEYNGTAWIQTVVNLTGPTGATGSSVGFDYIGGYNGANPPTSLNNENVAFPVPMPAGISGGANQLTNQGVSTVLLGGVGSTVNPPAGITYTSAFQIPNAMAVQLDSSLLSVLVHQKDSSAAAIRFMGGGDIVGEKYEQSVLNNLSSISLGIDDTLNFTVPKAATSPAGLSDVLGLNINTIRRGQQFYAGKHINLISGTDSTPSGFGGEISDITLTINTSNTSIPAKLSVATTFSSASALFEVGGNIILPTSTTRTGSILLDAGNIRLVTSANIRLLQSSGNGISITPAAVDITGVSGPVTIQTTAGQSINLSSNATSNIDITPGTILIQTTTTINEVSPTINLYGGNTDHWLRVDNTSITLGGTKLKGNFTWNSGTGMANPFVTTYRNISINKGSLIPSQSPFFIGDQLIGNGRSLVLEAFKGLGQSTAIEYLRLYTASTDIINTSGNAGFVGHTVENTFGGVALSGAVGFRVRGVDRITGNLTPADKFFAGEEKTAVSNRLQYVRKIQNIDPIWAGLSTSAGNGFQIPVGNMDASHLEVRIVGNGTARSSAGTTTADTWDLFIPNGFYTGQRLIVHVIAFPVSYIGTILGSPASTQWPIGSTGNVDIWVQQGTASSGFFFDWVKIGRVSVQWTPRRGGEATFELLWAGTIYQSVDYNEFIGNDTFYRTSGWLVTNGTGISNANSGTYTAVQNSQAWAT